MRLHDDWLIPDYIYSHWDIAAKVFAVLVVGYFIGAWWLGRKDFK